MLVYLDTCALQRPLDDRSQLRVRVEADILLAVIAAAEGDVLELVSSAVAVSADFFCTVDDSLLRKAKTANTGATRVVSPLELVAELAP